MVNEQTKILVKWFCEMFNERVNKERI